MDNCGFNEETSRGKEKRVDGTSSGVRKGVVAWEAKNYPNVSSGLRGCSNAVVQRKNTPARNMLSQGTRLRDQT